MACTSAQDMQVLANCLMTMSKQQLLAAWTLLACEYEPVVDGTRITEEGVTRITEEGDTRIIE